MIQKRIERRLAQVASRSRRLWSLRALSVAWLAVAALAGAALAARWIWDWHAPWVAPALVLSGTLAGIACFRLGRRVAGNPLSAARRIEARYPDLDSRLLAALEQKPALPGGRFGFLQETVLREVFVHAHRNPWLQAVPDLSEEGHALMDLQVIDHAHYHDETEGAVGFRWHATGISENDGGPATEAPRVHVLSGLSGHVGV